MPDKSTDQIEFDWIELRRDLSSLHTDTETQKEKLYRKISENPFVPLGIICIDFRINKANFVTVIIVGCIATTIALGFGLWNFRRGNRVMSQYMMRARIAAQGLTIVALIGGLAMGASSMTPRKKAVENNN